MGIMFNIMRDLKRDKIHAKGERVRRHYEGKNRLIDQAVYISLKSRKKCMRCKKNFGGRIPEIHHKIPISKGGTNERMNLMALCHKCHEILDAQAGVSNEKN